MWRLVVSVAGKGRLLLSVAPGLRVISEAEEFYIYI